jgi:hypothetical protein
MPTREREGSKYRMGGASCELSPANAKDANSLNDQIRKMSINAKAIVPITMSAISIETMREGILN